MVNKDLKKNSKIRTVNMMIQSALIIILIVLVANMMVEIKNLQGTARVINYAGLVRGATQRVVKLEVIGNSDDELIEYLDDVLADLKYEDGEYNLVSLRDTDYQKKLDIQIDYWGKLKNEINNVRENGVDNSDIVDITEGLKSAVEEKLGKLDRFFAPETEVNVTLSVEKERQKIEVTIPVKGNIIRSEQVSSDMYVSIDLVEEVIERQLKKYKNKIVDKQQNAAAFAQEFVEKDYDDDEVKIIRTKRFGIKPMDPEEACVQMELLGHNFYVFFNSETEEVNVVYKRKGNTYGLIEPELD